MMFKNYIKIALRGLRKHRAYSLINISGLAIGMAVALLIGLWIYYEYSYDRFLPEFSKVYRVKRHYTLDKVYTSNAISLPLVDILRNEIPGIQYVAQADWGGSDHSLVVANTRLYLAGTFVGVDFLNIFQFPLVQGDAATALINPNSILLTASTASALFGQKDPMNQAVRFDNSQELMVTGVIEDPPPNSTHQFNYLVPFAFMEQNMAYVREAKSDWGMNGFTLFAKLESNVKYAQIAPKIKNILAENSPETRATKQELSMQPMTEWHLYGKYENGRAVGGFIEYLWMFGTIGLLVLLIACINFMNLATARSAKRAKEVGIRKAIGSKRKQIITQFLSESSLLTLLSFGLALLMVYLALGPFNQLLGSQVSVPLEQPVFWLIMLVYIGLTALLAGSRSAFYLSSFNPVKVLKGTVQSPRSAAWARKVLVVLQFSCSVVLIICTLIIYQQIKYVKNRPTGYDQHRLLMTDISEDLGRNYEALTNELRQSGLVTNVTRSSSSATDVTYYSNIDHWPGKQESSLPLGVAAITITDTYFETMGMSLLEGRNFGDNPTADSNSVILNEAAVKQLGISDPIGQRITWHKNQQATIIGVVKDAVLESPYNPVEPVLFTPRGFWVSIIYRLSPQVSTSEALGQLGKIFDKFNPAYAFEYRFVDEAHAQKFHLEVLVGKLAGLFAGLAIFVSCLGLFGLAAYLAEQRRKEIGIRKVFGATVLQIWTLLSGEFLLLVSISCILASPPAFYLLQNWLRQYSYRIEIGPAVFIITGIVVLLITLVTISFQTIRTSRIRPAESLRAE